MADAADPDLDLINRRIDGLIDALSRTADPRTLRQVQELVGLLLDAHGLGWSRLLQRVDASSLLDDELLVSLLLLHDLHPVPLTERAVAAVARLPTEIGAAVESIEGNQVRVQLRCASSAASNARIAVERAMESAAPDAVLTIEVETPIELRPRR